MPPTGEHDGPQLRDYLAVLHRRKWWVLLSSVLVAGTVLAFSLLQTPVYRGTVEILLRPRASELVFAPDQEPSPAAVEALVQTEIRVLESRSVREAVEEELGREVSPSIEARGGTEVVAISVDSTDPAVAAEMADTYARVYVETRRRAQIDNLVAAAEEMQAQIDRIQSELAALGEPDTDLDRQLRSALQTRLVTYMSQLDQLQLARELTATGGAQIISDAAVPEAPIRPVVERNVAIALALGLMLGVALAFLRDHFDDSIRSTDDFARVAPGVTVLGVIPRHAEWKPRDGAVLSSVTAPASPTAEAHRTLRTSVQFVGLAQSVKVLQATSPGAGDGKSATIANLGVQLARTGRRVVLVDCDLRRPRLHEFFDADNAVGFTSALLGERSLADALVAVSADFDLVLLPSGPPPPNPSELLSTTRAADTLRLLAEQADYVLIDSPPVLPVADALVVARAVDATLVVVRLRQTSRRATGRAFELLGQVGAPVIGAVLNDVDATGDYLGSSGYSYDTEPAPSRSRARRARRNGARAANEGFTAVRR